ncbi:hypothetical protein LR48_Vigan10g112200 [Vigna angularis]|uniref:Uncharacterized protein n=1 Tax=Phaseolus angularis TaxID=3914 RepID=A0A0L9VJK7_PHAAN|nr:hypothetical protein LR48_Vigan10g112200 [Vigna angularis]
MKEPEAQNSLQLTYSLYCSLQVKLTKGIPTRFFAEPVSKVSDFLLKMCALQHGLPRFIQNRANLRFDFSSTRDQTRTVARRISVSISLAGGLCRLLRASIVVPSQHRQQLRSDFDSEIAPPTPSPAHCSRCQNARRLTATELGWVGDGDFGTVMDDVDNGVMGLGFKYEAEEGEVNYSGSCREREDATGKGWCKRKKYSIASVQVPTEALDSTILPLFATEAKRGKLFVSPVYASVQESLSMSQNNRCHIP